MADGQSPSRHFSCEKLVVSGDEVLEIEDQHVGLGGMGGRDDFGVGRGTSSQLRARVMGVSRA
jgi:hypothetical protein